jgi:hypothetical protein
LDDVDRQSSRTSDGAAEWVQRHLHRVRDAIETGDNFLHDIGEHMHLTGASYASAAERITQDEQFYQLHFVPASRLVGIELNPGPPPIMTESRKRTLAELRATAGPAKLRTRAAKQDALVFTNLVEEKARVQGAKDVATVQLSELAANPLPEDVTSAYVTRNRYSFIWIAIFILRHLWIVNRFIPTDLSIHNLHSFLTVETVNAGLYHLNYFAFFFCQLCKAARKFLFALFEHCANHRFSEVLIFIELCIAALPDYDAINNWLAPKFTLLAQWIIPMYLPSRKWKVSRIIGHDNASDVRLTARFSKQLVRPNYADCAVESYVARWYRDPLLVTTQLTVCVDVVIELVEHFMTRYDAKFEEYSEYASRLVVLDVHRSRYDVIVNSSMLAFDIVSARVNSPLMRDFRCACASGL